MWLTSQWIGTQTLLSTTREDRTYALKPEICCLTFQLQQTAFQSQVTGKKLHFHKTKQLSYSSWLPLEAARFRTTTRSHFKPWSKLTKTFQNSSMPNPTQVPRSYKSLKIQAINSRHHLCCSFGTTQVILHSYGWETESTPSASQFMSLSLLTSSPGKDCK